MECFILDPQLADDTHDFGSLGLNRLLLMDDKRYPWLILVPQRSGVTELHELTPMDQALMTFEVTQIAEALQKQTGCHKVNIAALGNQVRQLHVHIIARFEDDAAWPKPVWGSGQAVPYVNGEAARFVEELTETL